MLRKFLYAKEGNFAAILAIASIPLMAAVAGIVDFVSVNNKATKLQDALDTAAIAVATKYYSGMSATELEEMGREFFNANVSVRYTNPDEFDYVAPEDDFSAQALSAGLEDFITVRSSVAHQGMLGSQNWKARRESVVRISPGEPACVLALDPHALSSINIQGSAKINMNGCLIAANSDSSEAISRGGSAEISAECVTTVGGTSGLEGSSYAQLECPQPFEYQYPTRDPRQRITTGSHGMHLSTKREDKDSFSRNILQRNDLRRGHSGAWHIYLARWRGEAGRQRLPRRPRGDHLPAGGSRIQHQRQPDCPAFSARERRLRRDHHLSGKGQHLSTER